jgi:pyruvate dehydrogenase E1 component beta subunit
VAGELVSSIQENVFDYLDAPVRRLGGIYSPIPHSPPLVEQSIPQAADVVRAATALVAARRATQ